MVIYARDLSRALSKLQVIAKNSDSFIVLFAPVMFGGVITLVFVFQVICQKLGLRASSRVPNTEKQMKVSVSRCLEPVMKHEARVFYMSSQMKQEMFQLR